MSSNYYGKKIAELALSYDGVAKGSSKHHKLVDEFNKVKPNGEVATYASDWCAIFWTAILHMSGFSKAEAPMSYNVGKLITLAKDKDMWIESDKHVPEVGDGIVYDWSDNGVGENKDGASHIGIVYKVSKNYIYVVEGNTSTTSKVGCRKVAVNGRFIRGFIHLKHRAKRINEVALQLAWPKGTKSGAYSYNGGKPNTKHKKLWKKYFPNKKNTAGCHQYVKLVLKECGYASMPLTWDKILKYMKKRFDVVDHGYKKSRLRSGDIGIYKRVDSSGKAHYHIWIIVNVDGKKVIAEAQQSKNYAHIHTDLDKAVKKRDKVWYFRAR